MTELEYYSGKMKEMLSLAATCSESRTRREFQRLADEYRSLVDSAEHRAAANQHY